MPVFGLGTWQMGGMFDKNPSNDDERDIFAIRRAMDAGVTHIDTAEIYAAGRSEELVGRAIEGYERKKLFIASKVHRTHCSYSSLIGSCKASLKRLGTEYLDLYMIHSFGEGVVLPETMRAMDFLVREGLIRNIGVSNFTKERLAEAQSLTGNKIAANQVHYNLIFREPERTGLLRFCQDNDVMLVAWRPVQKGALSSPGTPLLDRMCRRYGKTPSQVAINWLISQRNVVTLAKTSSEAHLKENLGSLGWSLSAEDIEALREGFPGQKEVSDAVPLG